MVAKYESSLFYRSTIMIKGILDKEGQEIKPKSDKEPVAVYCIADVKNFGYALNMLRSLRHFHDWPVYLYTNETDKEKLKLLPKDITLVDLDPYLQDRAFFYRSTPILAEPLLDKYDCVLKIDADSLILGDLSFILEATDYDVGTVINWNRFDEKFYPLVQGWGIFPAEYFNCGLVALRSKKFAHEWVVNCFTPQFDRLQYKEQDILNAMCYYGNWNVRCFDQGNPEQKRNSWFGIIGKGEWNRSFLDMGRVIIPKGLGDTPFPPSEIQVRVAHLGGGAGAPKDNWGSFFPENVMERIKELTS